MSLLPVECPYLTLISPQLVLASKLGRLSISCVWHQHLSHFFTRHRISCPVKNRITNDETQHTHRHTKDKLPSQNPLLPIKQKRQRKTTTNNNCLNKKQKNTKQQKRVWTIGPPCALPLELLILPRTSAPRGSTRRRHSN